MSASAVFNLIAPSAPLPAQAANDADASAFGGLLSDALSGEVMADDTATPRPTTSALREPAKSAPKAASDDSASSTLIDPTGLGLIQTLPPVPVDDVAETTPVLVSDADKTAKGDDQPPVMPLTEVQPILGQTAGAPTITAQTSAVTTAQSVLPAATATEAADAALLAAAAQAATDDAQTQPKATPDKTAATTPPVPQVQPPAPPPLKPASERTGRSADSLTREGDAVASDGSKPSPASSSAPTATPTPAPGKTSTDAVLALSSGAGQGADADLSGDLSADGASASLDTAKAHAEAAITHDASLSTLSRATIDATAQIAAQIIRKLDGKSTRFEMALTPDDLGRVDVKLEIDAEGRLAARMAFDNPAAAADLRGRADELRRQLQDAGFHVPDDAFEFAERDSGSSAFDRGPSDQNDNQRQNRAFSAASRLNAEIDVAQPPRWMSLSLSPSGVDLKV